MIPPNTNLCNYCTNITQASSRAARTAATYIENVYLEVLGPDIVDVFIAKIAMQNGEILDGAWQDVIGSESAVSKSNVLRSMFAATAPLTFDS